MAVSICAGFNTHPVCSDLEMVEMNGSVSTNRKAEQYGKIIIKIG